MGCKVVGGKHFFVESDTKKQEPLPNTFQLTHPLIVYKENVQREVTGNGSANIWKAFGYLEFVFAKSPNRLPQALGISLLVKFLTQ